MSCALVDPISEDSMRRLYRARCTTFEMLRDRGYALGRRIPPEREFASRLLRQRKEDVFSNLAIRASGPKGLLYAFFSFSDKVGIGVIRDVVDFCQKKEVSHAIIVHSATITPFAKAKMSEMTSDPEITLGRIECFTFDQMLFNPTKHVDVPPHKLLSKEETASVLERPGVTRESLPCILSSDAISRYYGAHRGQIFRILRKNPEGCLVEALRVVSH